MPAGMSNFIVSKFEESRMSKLLEKLKDVRDRFRKTVKVDLTKADRIRSMNERSKRAGAALRARKV